MSILISYLSNNGDITKLDTSCKANVLPLQFQMDGNFASYFLNVSDAYDGVIFYPSISSTYDVYGGSDTAFLQYFIPFLHTLLALGITILIALVLSFLLCYRRRQIAKSHVLDANHE